MGGGAQVHRFAEVGSGEGFLVEVLVEQGAGDVEVGVLGFQFYGAVHVAQSLFVLAALLIHAAAYGIDRGIVGPIAEQDIDVFHGFLRTPVPVAKEGKAQTGFTVAGLQGDEAFIIGSRLGIHPRDFRMGHT